MLDPLSQRLITSDSEFKKSYDSDTGAYNSAEMKTKLHFKDKLKQLNAMNKVIEIDDADAKNQDQLDPLFMNIDSIAKLPLASKTPVKIAGPEPSFTVGSTAPSTTASTSQNAAMQRKQLEMAEERRTEVKKKVEKFLESAMIHNPVTPRTMGGSRNSSGVFRFKKVDNFIRTLFNDDMTIQNWVSSNNITALRNKKLNMHHLWYQFNESNEIIKDAASEKQESQNLDFFRDLGPCQRMITSRPE